jgi:hypothetical protein
MGEQNRFGKLPFTWYNSKFTAASDFGAFDHRPPLAFSFHRNIATPVASASSLQILIRLRRI